MKKPYPHSILVLFFMAVFGLKPILAYGAELKFIPQLSLREQYNDNIYFDSYDNERTNDFATVISPSLKLTDKTERLDASIQSRLERIEYLEEEELDSTDQYHIGKIGYRLTEKMNVSAEAGYISDSQVDRDIETTGLVVGTPTRRQHYYACAAGTDLSIKTSIRISYKYNKEKFDDPEYTDCTTQNVSLALFRNLDALLPQTIGQINTGYAQYDYPYTEVTVGHLTVGASKKFTEAFEFFADIGGNLTRSQYEVLDLFDESSKTLGGIGQIALRYKGELSNAVLSYYRDVRSISGKSGIARYSSVRLYYSRRFTNKLAGEFTTEYYLNKHNKKQFWETAIDEETFRIKPRLLYELTQDLRLEASYRYTRLKDKDAGQKKTQGLIFLGLTWQYPVTF